MQHIRIPAAILATTVAGASIAAVSAEEAKQLGGSTLTPWGAERAGNKEGTISAEIGVLYRLIGLYSQGHWTPGGNNRTAPNGMASVTESPCPRDTCPRKD